MTPQQHVQELCDKIELLLREYGINIAEYYAADVCEEHSDPTKAPDWSHPMAIQHWALVLTVDDINPSGDDRGFWEFCVRPPGQRDYITTGLLQDWMDGRP